MAKKKEDKMLSILTSVDSALKKQSSFKTVFIQGLVRGFGTALGATVLVALATSLTLQMVDTVDLHTFSSYFMNNAVEE